MSIVFFQKERRNVAALFSHLFLSLRVFPCVLGEWKKKKNNDTSLCVLQKNALQTLVTLPLSTINKKEDILRL